MTTRSLYPLGQPSQLAEGRQSHSPQASAFYRERQAQPGNQAANRPKHTQTFRDLRQSYALERRSFL